MAEPSITNSDQGKAWLPHTERTDSPSPIILVCEHASNHIPATYNNLGLTPDQVASHIAWDPGALGVACALSEHFNAPLIAGAVSRLLFDCNRTSDAVDAIAEISEIHRIPGNQALDPQSRQDRVNHIYEPFRRAIADTIGMPVQRRILITVHSFVPVYKGTSRDVDIGILHDSDDRLANELLSIGQNCTNLILRRNDPYGPEDGVTHTLKEHGVSNGILNVMLEIRNDLIETPAQQNDIAALLADMIGAAAENLAVDLASGEN